MVLSAPVKCAGLSLLLLVVTLTLLSFTATDTISPSLSWSALTPPFARSVQSVLAEAEAPKCGIDDRIAAEYGQTNLRLSRRHEGSRYRLAKVLDKAKRGEKVRVAVLGGSVSTGHGHANGKNYQPSTPSRGWKLWDWKDEKYYWQAKTPSAEATFDIEVRKGEGIVAISYLRSRAYDLGRVVCRVGTQKATVDGHWERSVSVAQTAVVATGLPSGTHKLVCTTPDRPPKGRNVFRLIGVLSR